SDTEEHAVSNIGKREDEKRHGGEDLDLVLIQSVSGGLESERQALCEPSQRKEGWSRGRRDGAEEGGMEQRKEGWIRGRRDGAEEGGMEQMEESEHSPQKQKSGF
ncbi:unnamed protein product, partial [Pleuronectes platessa]